MKHLFPTNPTVEILKEENSKVTIFVPLEERMCNDLRNEFQTFVSFGKNLEKRAEYNKVFNFYHGFGFNNILALGDTKIETRLANTYIQSNYQRYFGHGKEAVNKRNYKCFVNKDWESGETPMGMPYHEDGGCAWNCLMQKLRNPEFGIIFEIEVTTFEKLRKLWKN